MAISLVGTPQGGSNTNGGNVTLTFDVAPQQGDVVYVFGCHSDRSPTNVSGPSTSGYTEIKRVTAASSIDFSVFRKVMGVSPDSNVVCKGSTNSSDACSYGCYVLRGVDNSTPEDVAATSAGPTIGGQPNCPSIDPVTVDCWILALMGNRINDATITAPTGYANNNVTSTGNDTVDTSIYGGTKFHSGTHAAEDPPATTNWAEGNAWGAVTVAVRPAAAPIQPPRTMHQARLRRAP
jgi:hypothetical protein